VKTTPLDRLEENIQKVIEEAQSERIFVMKDGKPVAVVFGLEMYDAEDWGYMSSKRFWEMIRDSRDRDTFPLANVREELLKDE
jgi:hypothetical protein